MSPQPPLLDLLLFASFEQPWSLDPSVPHRTLAGVLDANAALQQLQQPKVCSRAPRRPTRKQRLNAGRGFPCRAPYGDGLADYCQLSALTFQHQAKCRQAADTSRQTNKAAIDTYKVCAKCGTNDTPQWRRGASTRDGTQDLCNRCGIEWFRRTRKKPRK